MPGGVSKRVLRLRDRRRFVYLTAGTLGATRIAAAEQGLSPRKSDHSTGHATRAATLGSTIAPFSNGQLHYLLTNPVYRGLIRHKSLVHPGQHPAIIDEAQWSAVQTKLQETATPQAAARRRTSGHRGGFHIDCAAKLCRTLGPADGKAVRRNR